MCVDTLVNHLKLHGSRKSQAANEEVLPLYSPQHTYPTCGLVYSLTRHFKIHKDEFQLVTAKNGQFKYHIFNFPHLYKS